MKQMIKPHRLKQRQKKQLAALTLIIMIAGICAIMMLTPLFNITEITVRGNSVVSDEDIIRSGGIVRGINIFSVSLGKAEKAIEQMGYIDGAKLRRRLPGEIEITVEEAAGVAYVSTKSGYIIITADGRMISRTDRPDAAASSDDKNEAAANSLPIVKGLDNVKYKTGAKLICSDEEKRDTLIECLKEFTKGGYIFDMTEINVSSLSDITFGYNGGKLTVMVGSPEKIGYKMECFGPILAEIGDDPSGYVDLQRLTYRKKQE